MVVPDNILVRATNWVGDAVMSLPALRALRQRYPQAHITILAKPWVADLYRREHLPYEAAFLAGKAFLRYRQTGGTRRSPLPDFYIGAHAAVAGYRLLTRDATRYRTYFPTVDLIAPPRDGHCGPRRLCRRTGNGKSPAQGGLERSEYYFGQLILI